MSDTLGDFYDNRRGLDFRQRVWVESLTVDCERSRSDPPTCTSAFHRIHSDISSAQVCKTTSTFEKRAANFMTMAHESGMRRIPSVKTEFDSPIPATRESPGGNPKPGQSSVEAERPLPASG